MSIDTLTYEEAFIELTRLMEHPETLTIAELKALVERVSVIDPTVPVGSTTYRYSGNVSTDIGSSNLVRFIDDEYTNINTIRSTPAFKFLNSIYYAEAVYTTFANENPSLDFMSPEFKTGLRNILMTQQRVCGLIVLLNLCSPYQAM